MISLNPLFISLMSGTAAALVGGALLLADEASGLAIDFTTSQPERGVAVKETLGPELVTNGGFDGSASSWTLAGGAAYGSNAVTVTSVGAGQKLNQPLSLTAGKLYAVRYTLSNISGAGLMRPAVNPGPGAGAGTFAAIAGSNVQYIVAGTGATYAGLYFEAGATAVTFTIDNISVREVITGSDTGTLSLSEMSFDEFLTNAGTSPKLVYDATGTLVWSPHNMVLQSENFGTSWSTVGLTHTGSAAVSPDSRRADLLVETTATSEHQVTQTVAFVAGATYTHTIDVKAYGTLRNFRIRNQITASPGFGGAVVSLVDGSVLTAFNGVTSSDITTTLLGDGWWRISMRFVAASTGNGIVYFGLASGTTGSYAGGTTEGFYLSAAQVNRGTTPTAYLATTTAARYGLAIDHDPVTGESLGVLVEPAATNLLTYSSQFDNAAWTKTNVTVTADNTTAPDGRSSADKVQHSSAAGQVSQITTVSSAATVTVSYYVKADVDGFVRPLTYGATSSDFFGGWFNTATGEWATTSAGGNGSITSTFVEELPNGWYRIGYTGASDGTSYTNWVYLTASDNTTTRSTTPAVYLWNAQLETGSVATSPIPTFGATVTRAADDPNNLLSAIPFGAPYSTYIEFVQSKVQSGGNGYVFSLNDGTGNNIAGAYVNTSGEIRAPYSFLSAAAAADVDAGDQQAGVVKRLAERFKTDDFAASLNGAAAVTDTAGNLPTVTRINFGSRGGGATMVSAPIHIRKFMLVPRGWANDNLQARTAA